MGRDWLIGTSVTERVGGRQSTLRAGDGRPTIPIRGDFMFSVRSGRGTWTAETCPQTFPARLTPRSPLASTHRQFPPSSGALGWESRTVRPYTQIAARHVLSSQSSRPIHHRMLTLGIFAGPSLPSPDHARTFSMVCFTGS
jgi:hypothetical protein